jgi:hypothetical protein
MLLRQRAARKMRRGREPRRRRRLRTGRHRQPCGRDVCLVMAGIRRYLRAIFLIAFTCAVCSGGHAQAPKQKAAPVETTAPKPAQIDRNGVLILIRSALLALDQANKTGNYTVLRDLGAPGFQINTAARLGEIFAKQRADNLDLSGVAVIDPQLSLLPQIEPNGMMRMAGFFPLRSIPGQFRARLCAGERTVAALRHLRFDWTERACGPRTAAANAKTACCRHHEAASAKRRKTSPANHPKAGCRRRNQVALAQAC